MMVKDGTGENRLHKVSKLNRSAQESGPNVVKKNVDGRDYVQFFVILIKINISGGDKADFLLLSLQPE